MDSIPPSGPRALVFHQAETPTARTRSRLMVARSLLGSVAVVGAFVFAGCGGGGGSPAPALAGKSTIKARAIETARVNRTTFAVAGLARHVTRATRRSTQAPGMGAQITRATLRGTRAQSVGTQSAVVGMGARVAI